MSDPLFNVILEAECLPGFEREQVIANLSNLFKISTDKAAALISAGERVLKQAQQEGAARKYAAALKRAGAKVRLEAIADTALVQPATDSTTPAPGAALELSSTTQPSALQASTTPTKPAATPDDALPDYGFTLAPQEGNLLKTAELPPPPAPPALNLDQLSIAPEGSDVLETQYRKLPVPKIEPPANLRVLATD